MVVTFHFANENMEAQRLGHLPRDTQMECGRAVWNPRLSNSSARLLSVYTPRFGDYIIQGLFLPLRLWDVGRREDSVAREGAESEIREWRELPCGPVEDCTSTTGGTGSSPVGELILYMVPSVQPQIKKERN